jgi:aspartate-semialdehyde dehydrogenase
LSVVALVEPASLLGQSLREGLEADRDLTIRLVGGDGEEYGTLTRVRDEVVVVQPLSAESLSGADLIIACGDARRQEAALALRPAETPALVVASDFDHPPGALCVRGVTAEAAVDPVTVSPHAAVLLLCRVLFALAEHRPRRASATLLQPASSRDGRGLEELFEQTRSILAFSDESPRAVFGRQLAFNLLPVPPAPRLAEQVREILGRPIDVAAQILQTSVFHGLAASLMVELEAPAAGAQVAASLARGPGLELDAAPQGLGPIDVTGREQILLGEVVPVPGRPDAVWLWAVVDNLAGGAGNALGLARSILGRAPHPVH